ncbi:hypothetical protein AB0B15_42980 [Streptomyces sp. NPDC045456]|uniref:hypothetical protein n=1 Tax=Streptomyces sp. NPDC045456 TaxID=3155254 RepID=UPI0033D9D3AF
MTTEIVQEAGEQATEQTPEQAADGTGLRAFLPDRRFARSLCAGTAVLVGRGWAWITADGAKEAGARLGYTAIGAYVAVYSAGTMPQVVMPVGLVGWCAAALMLAPSPPPPGPAPAVSLTKVPADDDLADDFDQEDDEDLVLDLDTVARLVRTVAADHGHQGAHLATLVATGELGDWDQQDLRDALTEWGVPVEEFKLRFSGRQRVRIGVRLRALPEGVGEAPVEPPPGTPSGPPSGAGEGAPLRATQHPADGPESAPGGGPVGGPAGAAAGPSPRLSPDPSHGAR